MDVFKYFPTFKKICQLGDINDGCMGNDNFNHYAIHIHSLFGKKGLDFVA